MKYVRLTTTLLKRLFKKPSFILLLLIIPIVTFIITNISTDEKSKSDIGVYFTDNFGDNYLKIMQENSDIINFVEYENLDDLILDVKKEKIDCGFAFGDEFYKKLMTDKWKNNISVYRSSSSLLQNLAQEQIASSLFRIYSENTFYKYANRVMGEETFEYAKEKYKEHLMDDSTFSIEYQGSANENKLTDNSNQGISINLNGILAVLVFIGGLNSLLLNYEDKSEKRFITFCSNWKVTLVNIGTQTLLLAIMALISMIMTNTMGGIETLLKMAVYVLIVVCYCFVLSFIFRTKESIAISIPILTLLSLICCPIIIDIASYIPLFSIVNKFFPPTYFM